MERKEKYLLKLEDIIISARNDSFQSLAANLILNCFIFLDIPLNSNQWSLNKILSSISSSTIKRIFLRLLYEFTIVSYYTKHRSFGFYIYDSLLLSNKISKQFKLSLGSNIRFYINQLSTKKRIPINVELPFIHENSTEKYRPMNPSMIKIDDGYLMICRSINYKQHRAVTFTSFDLDKKIRTRNFLLKLNKEFKILSQQEIIDCSSLPKNKNCRVLGFEDCALFRRNDELWFSCTTLDTSIYGIPQISLSFLGNLTNIFKEDKIKVTKVTPLVTSSPFRCEKNWLPFILENNIHFVYLCDPMTIKTVVFENEQPISVIDLINRKSIFDFTSFRGSSCPISFNLNQDKGYLFVIHHVIFADNGRYYFHRFVWMNDAFFIKACSLLWYIDHKGIEFCKSICYGHNSEELLLGVGIEDKEVWIYPINIEQIKSMLNML